MSCICQNPEATQVTINGIVYCETLETMPPSCKPKSCPPGYTLSEDGTECTSPYDTGNLCPNGYIYIYDEEDPASSYCQAGTNVPADCVCTADVIASPQTICSGSPTSIALTSTVPTGIVYSWVVLQNGVNGGTSGNSINDGNIITQNLIATGSTNGTATYTITPYEGSVNGCSGTPITVIVTVKPKPDIIIVPSSPQTIASGDSINLALSSSVVGTTFSWTVSQSAGVTGATSGSGTSITDTISATLAGAATYTITATAPNGCTTVTTFVVNVELPIEACLNGFIVDIYTTSPDCSAHGCSHATFKLLANSVDLGFAYMSNAGGTPDQGNTADVDPAFPIANSTSRRVTRFVVTPTEAAAIAATTVGGDITLQLACDQTTGWNNYGGVAGACHSSASHMRVYLAGNPTPIDYGCPAYSAITINPCTGAVTPPAI
jgi:hypothetical protein